MRGYVTDWRGREWLLPYPTQWELEYTAGVPCDSFTFRCPWEMGERPPLETGSAFPPGTREKICSTEWWTSARSRWTQGGCQLEISGRGLAALLLDNEAIGQDYGTATLADILRDHVTPYGIQTAPGAALPAVTRFSVATGSSEWSVVYDFARYYGGVCPRFDRLGRLVLVWLAGQPGAARRGWNSGNHSGPPGPAVWGFYPECWSGTGGPGRYSGWITGIFCPREAVLGEC